MSIWLLYGGKEAHMSIWLLYGGKEAHMSIWLLYGGKEAHVSIWLLYGGKEAHMSIWLLYGCKEAHVSIWLLFVTLVKSKSRCLVKHSQHFRNTCTYPGRLFDCPYGWIKRSHTQTSAHKW